MEETTITLLLVNGMRFDLPWKFNEAVPNLEVLKRICKANDGFLTEALFIRGDLIAAIWIGAVASVQMVGPVQNAPTTGTTQ